MKIKNMVKSLMVNWPLSSKTSPPLVNVNLRP